MKTKINLVFLTLILGVLHPSFSQDSLLKINVSGPNLTDVLFLRNTAKPDTLTGIAPFNNLNIKLTITPPHKVAKIVFTNMIGNINPFTVTEHLQDTIHIVNRSLNGFQLSDNFKIAVFLTNNLSTPPLMIKKPTQEEQDKSTTTAPKVGSMINDAIKLIASETPTDQVLAILAVYAGVEQDWNKVSAAYASNIYISPLIEKRKPHGPSAQGNNKALAGITESISGLNWNTIILGVTDFILKRAKEELNIAFFQRFQEFMMKPEYKDLATIFPSTWQTLNSIGTEIYNYNRYLPILQTAFKNDIAQLTNNLPLIIDNHPVFFETHPELKASLLSGLYIAQGLRDGIHPGEIIDEYDTELLDGFGTNIPGVGAANPNFKTSVELIQLLSFSLRSQPDESTGYWIDPKMVRKVFSKDSTAKAFIGLLYQKGITRFKKLDFTTATGTTDVLKLLNDPAIPAKFKAWESYLFTMAIKAKDINSLIKTYEAKASDSLKIEQLYTYFQASVDLLKYATRVTQLPGLKYPGFEQMFAVYFETAAASASLLVNANRAQYAVAIMDAVRVYSLVRNKDEIAIEKELLARIDAAVSDAEKILLRAELERSKAVGKLTQALFRYGSFMAAVADADSPKEVSDAIEVFALPSGSSRIKRETPFNVSLNAYAGVFGGYERIMGLKSDDKVTGNAYGLTVPIGIAISTGKNHVSYSAFISLIDLGAVAAFRAQNDSVNAVPSIQLKDIFSPGLFFSLGIPKSPISVNLGAQFGPNLRKVKVTDNDYSGSTYMRFSLSILVDIPLLNFYTKSKD